MYAEIYTAKWNFTLTAPVLHNKLILALAMKSNICNIEPKANKGLQKKPTSI